MKTAISSKNAPQAIGPYSQAIAMGNLLFCSGQIPLDPVSGELIAGDVTAQTEQVLQNAKALLSAYGLNFSHVVKTTVFLTDLSQFAEMNRVYATHFSEPFPARSTIQVSALPRGSSVEIEIIAATDA